MPDDNELLLAEATNEQIVMELLKRPGFVAVMVLSSQEALRKTELSAMPLQVVKFEGATHREAAVLLASGAATLTAQHWKEAQ